MSDEIQRSLGRIEGKLDGILDTHKKMIDDIDSLKSTRSYAFGIMAAIGTVMGIVGSYVGKAFAAILGAH